MGRCDGSFICDLTGTTLDEKGYEETEKYRRL
jgi:hypothetical protein